MTKIEPEIDPALRVPDLPASGNRTTRLIAIAVALIVLLALISTAHAGCSDRAGVVAPRAAALSTGDNRSIKRNIRAKRTFFAH